MVRRRALSAALIVGTLSTSVAHGAEPLRIGVLTDASSLYADNGGQGSLEAARLAVADAGGSVLGRTVELLYADHQSKADIASSIARKWIDENDVQMITDGGNSSVALAINHVSHEKNRIAMFTAAATTDLTHKYCSPTTVHYVYDTYSQAKGAAESVSGFGAATWFFITADYAFGHAIQRDMTSLINAEGGRVIGSVSAPVSSADFSSFLLQAHASGAAMIGLANAGEDFIKSVKQAREFGVGGDGRQRLVATLMFLSDINGLGLDVARGLTSTEGFYWDQNDETRAFARRFFAKVNRMPTSNQAGVYSAVRHYLKAVAAAGGTDAAAVMKAMRDIPVDDFFAHGGRIRADGRMVHDMLIVEVKSPAESKAPWDYYKILKVLPGREAFLPEDQSACPYLASTNAVPNK
ncbi:ABC transporter substrate-binding protein [Methylobacterium sp. J-030]|uniref:ABC transporter substrate-binding protein n=1 Tax=Methylobacterium sp. J-030 TaxID=2836627 RepID=UPI001FBA24D6|nr:ABC transporter substrate-binding protein [Methylobacterium sp. J-030]MCJ2072197.1 ABC transporter substrate-binding protein [Methylobacterium sp. J-030]